MDASTFRAWICEAARLVVDNADHLTHLDAAIGDADHGINLRRGLQAAVVMLDETDQATPAAVLATVGRALINKTGGASGPLYGTGFRQAAKTLGEDADVTAVQLGAALRAALEGIQQLGAANQGDKTMVDTLGPAVAAYQAVVDLGGDAAQAARSAADAAERGLRETVGMQARKGRASYLGARTIGHEDPGAASTVLILRALATATAGSPSTAQHNDGATRQRRPANRSVREPVGAGAMPATVHRWAGTAVAPGTTIAASWRVDRPVSASVGPVDADTVDQAFRAVAADLQRLAARLRAQGRHAAADIVVAGALIAGDPDLLAAARAAASTDDPLRAISDTVEGYAATLAALPDETLRERAADVRQVGRRVLQQIAHAGTDGGANPLARQFVLVAAEIGPADLLDHLNAGLLGAVAVRGGANSHAAIVARSVGLPLVTGVDQAVLDLPDNTPLLVDGDAGLVVVDPPSDEVARADAAAAHVRRRRQQFAAERSRPPVTADAAPFALLCNVASDTEVRAGRDSGADGIGLLRTELPFLDADRWPTEADHRRALRPILAEASGWPVTVRLLDFANDKIPPFLRGAAAGLRALLDDPAALAAQLRAIVDLGRGVQLRIMVPMVTAVDELQTVRAEADAVVAQLGAPPPLLGAMVETVAAVEAIGELCLAADFLSIGTNDLTADVLQLERTDPRARPELTAHPDVLGLLARVTAAATGTGRPLSVCGDAGAHATTLPLLLGAGVRQFSVACARIDETRYRLHRLDTAACAELFAEAQHRPNVEQTVALVRDRIMVNLP